MQPCVWNTLTGLVVRAGEQADNEWHDAINWLGRLAVKSSIRVIWSTTQVAEHLMVRMSSLCFPRTPLFESMVDEIFQKGLHEYRNENGLVLSGGGRWALIGREWSTGRVRWLQISMVSGASIGAFNGAIIAASPDPSELPYARGALGSSGE